MAPVASCKYVNTDLSAVTGSGEQGRILKTDIENLSKQAQPTEALPQAIKKPSGEVEVVKFQIKKSHFDDYLKDDCPSYCLNG